MKRALPLLLLTLLSGCKLADVTDSTATSPLFPLAVGRTWGYRLDNAAGCAANDNVMRVLSKGYISGKEAYSVLMPCTFGAKTIFAFNDQQVVTYKNASWVSFIDVPVSADHTWYTPEATYTWKVVSGQIETPAGKFSDCYTRLENGGPDYVQFCSGVGIVTIHHSSTFEGKWDLTLVSKTF